MLYPDKNTFMSLAETYNRIAVYREIAGDLFTPINLLNHFRDRENLFLLESAGADKSFSRFTYMGTSPQRVISFENDNLIIKNNNDESRILKNIDPIKFIENELKQENCFTEKKFGDFCGGYTGYIGYDMTNYMDKLRKRIREDKENPSMMLMQTDEFYVFDNRMGRLYAACSVIPGEEPHKAYLTATEKTLGMADELSAPLPYLPEKSSHSDISKDFDSKTYCSAVEKIKSEIQDGECIQTVLSGKYTLNGNFDPVNIYRAMRNINPTPYMFYFKSGERVVCGTSPEVHLSVKKGKATLKPIAGTSGIEQKNIEDVKKELLSDEKECAEHLMLLDLARNDLYSGCDTSSVKINSCFQAEVYSHLVHIVSEVEGKIRDDITSFELFCNTFPAGTVTGAPKIRAMELIDQYETSPRGFYAGCAGYFSYNQDIDTCIIIRSAMITKNAVILRAGAGIVFYSEPQKEYEEIECKLASLFAAIESMSDLENKNVFNDR